MDQAYAIEHHHFLPTNIICSAEVNGMSSFQVREKLESRYMRDEDGMFPGRPASIQDTRLERNARAVCKDVGINYNEMSPVQRLFLTHYKCSICKLVPLDYIDMRYHKKVRCGQCGHIVSFTSAGKYGPMRKKLAMFLGISEAEGDGS